MRHAALFLLVFTTVLPLSAQARLSEAEREWIESKAEIVFVGQTSYPPFEFIHPKRGEYTGMAIELIRWMATEYGFNAVFKPMSFSAAQAAVVSGEADALTGIFWSQDRERRFDFSSEVFSVPASIFVRSERTDIRELEDLSGKRVAVQRGDYAIEFLATTGIPVEYIYADDFPSALELLVSGQADALIGDEQIVLYYIYDGRLNSAVKKVAQELYVGSDCMAVAEGNAILRSILDKALAHAKSNGTLSRINEKWLGVGLSQEAGANVFTLPLLIGLGVVLLLASGVIIWNLQLNRVVKAKTAELFDVNAELKRSNQSLTVANAQLLRDMEERSRMEEERRKLEARMVKAQNSESLALMAGGVAHDFNNLLTAMIGGMDVALLSIDAASESAQYLREAINTARQAGDLAKRMLDFSGRSVFNRETLDLVGLVAGMAKVLEAGTPGKVPLRYELSAERVPVRGDQVQLRQMAVNLAVNAAEASAQSGSPVEIRVFAQQLDAKDLADIRAGSQLNPDRYAVLEVIDHGIGMDAQTLERIFEPFYTTKRTGRGLGLAALAGIVKSHGGAVAVTSEKGKGSRFRIILPLTLDDGSAAEPERAPAAEPERLFGTVLIVDDEDSIRKTTARLVESLGLTALSASGGMDAAGILQHTDVDAVLLDMTMPGLDGYETFVLIRNMHPNLPVILSTGYDGAKASERFKDGDLAGILMKPYNRETLYQTLISAQPSLVRTGGEADSPLGGRA